MIAAEEGSFSAAARSLRLSTLAAAKRVRTLEALVGRRLLETHTRGVRPTAESEGLLPDVRAVLETVDRLTARLASEAPPSDGSSSLPVRRLLLDTPAAVSAQRALQDAERLIALLIDVTEDAMAITRPSDNHLYLASDRFAELLGYTRRELEGGSGVLLELWSQSAIRELVREAVRSGETRAARRPHVLRRAGDELVADVSLRLFRVVGEPRLLATISPG